MAAAAQQRVVAAVAEQLVVAAQARERVDPVVAFDPVGQPVAGAVAHHGVVVEEEPQILDGGPQRVGAQRGAHRVRAGIGALGHDIAGGLDHIGVVARAAGHRVHALPAVEQVVAAIPGQTVVQRIAEAVDIQPPGQAQVLDIAAEGKAHRGAHRVGSGVGGFDHPVARAVDDIGVVAQPAGHRVAARAPIQPVVQVVARQTVVQHVAEPVRRRPGQLQILQPPAERVVDRRLHRVPVGAGLDHPVARPVDHIGVGAKPADHRVVARAAVERVVAVAAVEPVRRPVARDPVRRPVAGAVDRAGPQQRQVLQIRAQPVADRAADLVGARAGNLQHHVAGIVHRVGVVAGPPGHRVRPGAAVEPVVPKAATQLIVAGPAINQLVGVGIARHRYQIVTVTGIDRHSGTG